MTAGCSRYVDKVTIEQGTIEDTTIEDTTRHPLVKDFTQGSKTRTQDQELMLGPKSQPLSRPGPQPRTSEHNLTAEPLAESLDRTLNQKPRPGPQTVISHLEIRQDLKLRPDPDTRTSYPVSRIRS